MLAAFGVVRPAEGSSYTYSGSRSTASYQGNRDCDYRFESAGKKRKAFLQQQKAQNAVEWLSTQRDGLEKNMALQLVGKLEKALNQLKTVAVDNKQYLDKNMSYIDYNINVLTGAVAGVTYSAAEAGGVGTLTGTKMFEANI